MEGAFALDPEQYNWEDGASGGERPLVEWSVEDVCLWVEELGLPQYCETFRYNRVHGKKLIQVHCSDLPKMNITKFEHILQISRAVDDLSGRPTESPWRQPRRRPPACSVHTAPDHRVANAVTGLKLALGIFPAVSDTATAHDAGEQLPVAALSCGKRRLFSGALAAAAVAVVPAGAAHALTRGDGIEGMSLEAALGATLRAKAALKQLTASLSQDAGRDPLANPQMIAVLAEELAAALPLVGAEAAYNQRDWRLRLRGSPLDSMVSGFALLDRAADGASEEGQNRNISIKDIERLEEMEALTTAALDAVEALASEAKQHAQGDNSRELLLRARQYVLTAESALDGIIAELPKKELAAAAAKLVAQGA
eukprot:jgi/Tetstr1/435541/TSEL_024445.t1